MTTAMKITRLLRPVINAWMSVQVELHGQWSLKRLREFYDYSSPTRLPWLMFTCVITPIPCLLLNTVMDFVPLKDPELGRADNYRFWVRYCISAALITFGVLMQFIHLVPRLGMTRPMVLLFAVVSALSVLGFNYTMAGVIAFPVPFMLLVGTPMWFTSNATLFLYFYGRRLREDSTLLREFINTMAILVCQMGLTVVYPVYILGLVSIPTQNTSIYIVLLPFIKIVAKNIISAFVGSNHDMKPEVVIFNVEIFNALYVSLAMQNSTGVSTTLILFAVDFAQAWMSIADVHREHRHLEILMSKIPARHPLHGKNFLEVARALAHDDCTVTDIHNSDNDDDRVAVGENQGVADDNVVSTDPKVLHMPKSYLNGSSKAPGTSKGGVRVIPVTRAANKHSINAKAEYMVTAGDVGADRSAIMQKAVTKSRLIGQVFSEHERTEFLHVSTQLLFTIEFIILVEYTEVIVPFIYSSYMTAMFYLPNRAYYPQIADIDAAHLGRMVGNVLMYTGLELLSFFAMAWLLRRAVGVSALRQLGFVLQSQWEMVQSKLLLWIFYSVQNSLYHFGADFSFQFAWMRSKSD